MDGAHQLPLGGERHLADAPEAGVERVRLEPRLAGGDEQGALGRIALHPPASVLLLEGGVVRPVGGAQGAPHLLPQRAVREGFPPAEELSLGGVAGAGDVRPPAGGDQGAYGHLVAGQRPGLVAGDGGRGAERLHRRQAAHDGVARGHALHPDGEDGRDHRRESLRHGGDGQGDAQDEGVHHLVEAVGPLNHQDGHHDHGGDQQDDHAEHPPRAVELALQRGGLGCGLAQEPGDAPHLGALPGGGDHRPAPAVGGGRAAVDHVRAVAEVGRRRYGLGPLGHRQALAGEGRLRRLQGGGVQQAPVRRNGVALFEQDDVPRHEVGGGDPPALPVPQRGRLGRGHRSQGGDGALGAGLLDVPQDAVQQDDGEDDQGLVGQGGVPLVDPQGGGDGGGDQQQDDEPVRELGQEATPSGRRGLFRQLVAPVALEALLRGGAGEAPLGVALQAGHDRRNRQLVGGRGVEPRGIRLDRRHGDSCASCARGRAPALRFPLGCTLQA